MSRGESSFRNLPSFGAGLYDNLNRTKAIRTQFEQIAEDLVSRVSYGKLLDVGTGPGRLLLEVHRLNPEIELFGLDIAKSMVRLAEKKLTGIGVDLRQGSIQSTDYEDNFFDVVTCTGSFYLWDYPEECLDEVHRILKEKQSAYLYESYRDFNKDEFQQALKVNLQEEHLFRRLIVPHFLNRQLRMTYKVDEVTEIVKHTKFADSNEIDKITLVGLPIWLRIKLTKS